MWINGVFFVATEVLYKPVGCIAPCVTWLVVVDLYSPGLVELVVVEISSVDNVGRVDNWVILSLLNGL